MYKNDLNQEKLRRLHGLYKNMHSLNIKELKIILEWICVICAASLIVIWPLSGTIAARNSLLIIGCLTSMIWIYQSKPKISFTSILPLLLLLTVVAWLLICYLFITTNAEAQLYDLKGTWLRACIGAMMASGLGLMIAGNPKYIYCIWIAFTSLLLVCFSNYLLEVWSLKKWIISNYHFPFKGKYALVYNLTISCLFACSIINYNILKYRKEKNIKNVYILIISILVLVTCLYIFIASKALNGVIILITFILILKYIYITKNWRNLKNLNYKSLILTILILNILFIILQVNKLFYDKVNYLVEDIGISAKIDKYTEWQKDNRYSEEKVYRQDGTEINLSTANRIAWFIKGGEILIKNPLGAGFSHKAFRYFYTNENPYSEVLMTHSGWLDYALGVGLPGLTLTWIAIFIVIKKWISIRNTECYDEMISYHSVWILGGIIFLWLLVEISEREFIEQLFFIIALISAWLENEKINNKKI